MLLANFSVSRAVTHGHCLLPASGGLIVQPAGRVIESHGPLSPAGLASSVGLAVSAGCPAAVLGSSVFCQDRCRRRRLGVAVPASPGGQPAQVIDECWRAVL